MPSNWGRLNFLRGGTLDIGLIPKIEFVERRALTAVLTFNKTLRDNLTPKLSHSTNPAEQTTANPPGERHYVAPLEPRNAAPLSKRGGCLYRGVCSSQLG